ncbi:MAG: ATP-binding cassette domain-containing protein [Chloroflexi bacterium]|nr:ATP-binding cassette domain-containing protein [Chloroflexota bacterium]
MQQTLVEVRDLSKEFKRSNGEKFFAVKDVSFEIRRGEIFSLLGPNGAGKTTTISMISGLLQPTQGDALIGGHSITKESIEAKKLLGVVPQEIALYPTLSARQNLEFFGKMYGMGGAELAKRVDETLDFVDLRERQHDKVETFSGGMKRRVNISIGLLHKPQLLYMDEPTVGIDPQNRRRVLDTVLRLRDEQNVSVLYTSHLMEEVQEISNRVAIVDHGEIIAIGTVGELIQKVGEEDRLIFDVGDQPVPDALLEKIKASVEGVTSATYSQRTVKSEDGAEGAETSAPSDGIVTVFAKRGRRALPDIIRVANEAGLNILSVAVREPDLEAVFLHLTGRALRD